MSDKPIITITAADVAAKRSELAAAEAKAATIRDWLKAAEILGGGKALPSATAALLTRIGEFTLESEATVQKPDMTKAIERIANASPSPISKADLKGMLRTEGFKAGQLQNFFYTAISRLKVKRRIVVLPDGRIWKPPPGAT